jgi:hypothetical protein
LSATGRDDSADGSGWETVAPGEDRDRIATSGKIDGDVGKQSEQAPQISVPDFTGLTVAAVLRAAHRSGVELALNEGAAVTGVALHQEPKPGPADRGIVCRVVFGRRE